MDKNNKNEKPEKASPPPKPAEDPIPESVSNQIHEIMRRLRLLEERYSGVRKKTQFNEQNMLKDAKDIFEELKALDETVSEIKTELSFLTEKIAKLDEEVDNAVSKADFNVLAKYMNYWQPMDFLTRKEAEKLISDLKNSE